MMNSLDNYLESFEKQEETHESNIEVVENPVVEELLRIYEKWLGGVFTNAVMLTYNNVVNATKDLKYTAKDVGDFSLKIKEYENLEKFDQSGFFLSALINTSEEENFEICTEHLDKKLYALGFTNMKNITVIGSVGDGFGAQNEGIITVQGNTGHYTGSFLKRGKLTITGNVGAATGLFSKGGEIHISGEIEEIPNNCEASIYRYGELVWPDGVRKLLK